MVNDANLIRITPINGVRKAFMCATFSKCQWEKKTYSS